MRWTFPCSLREIGLCVLMSIFCLGLLMPMSAEAAKVRGRIDAYNHYSNKFMPTGGIMVTLFKQNGSRWNSVSKTRSNSKGLYFFNITQLGRYKIGPDLNNSISFVVNNNNKANSFDVKIIRLQSQ